MWVSWTICSIFFSSKCSIWFTSSFSAKTNASSCSLYETRDVSSLSLSKFSFSIFPGIYSSCQSRSSSCLSIDNIARWILLISVFQLLYCSLTRPRNSSFCSLFIFFVTLIPYVFLTLLNTSAFPFRYCSKFSSPYF